MVWLLIIPQSTDSLFSLSINSVSIFYLSNLCTLAKVCRLLLYFQHYISNLYLLHIFVNIVINNLRIATIVFWFWIPFTKMLIYIVIFTRIIPFILFEQSWAVFELKQDKLNPFTCSNLALFMHMSKLFLTI